MAGSEYRYLLEVYDKDNKGLLRQALVNPDWLPAIESARFKALCDGRPAVDDETIAPIWHSVYGQPHLSGVRASVNNTGGVETAVDIPLTYFLPSAQSVAQPLLESGALTDGEHFIYMVKAYPATGATQARSTSYGLTVEHVSPVSGKRRLSDFMDDVECIEGEGVQTFPVFVPRQVLREAEQLKDQAGTMETGGILIGYLWVDIESGMPFTEVTAFVPARHTVPGNTKLTFTPETWADLHAAIALRGQDESFAGWLHTHPGRSWCTCNDELKQIECPWSRQFFSKDDCALHRTVFYAAHHVAVVLGDRYVTPTGWETTSSAYGWQNGEIVPRAFHVLRSSLIASVDVKETNLVTTHHK